MVDFIIRKLFLVKEIFSRTGILHFERYRLLATPWFGIYLHKISQSDKDEHLHDHPNNFVSLILSGSYKEKYAASPTWDIIHYRVVTRGSVVRHDRSDVHQIELLSPHVWSLVFTYGKPSEWGYQTEFGWLEHTKYRKWKFSANFKKRLF